MGVAELSVSGFISKIIQDVDTGFCFTPLIGSGLSSPSGIIMGMEFTNYLAFTTYLVLSNPKTRPKTHGEGIPGPWDLRHQGWPPLPSNHEVDRARKWVLTEFEQLCERFELELNFEEVRSQVKSLSPRRGSSTTQGMVASLVYPRVPTIIASPRLEQAEERVRRVAEVLIRQAGQNQPTAAAAVDFILSDPTRSYQQRIVEMGIRALHDWRETLVVLSSVSVDYKSPNSSLIHGRQNNSVIDRFNSFITRDKRPNLGHKMLAHLSGPMRFHSLLTTNFDTLTEDAFQGLNLRMRVLPVSSRGHLPEPQTVGAECTLVKLHGEMQDTRADTSLDDEPSDEDKQTFVAYLTRGSGNVSKMQPVRESKRLLVIGYSGSDQRCVQMIRHWLEKAPDHPILYWICFSESDVERVKKLFAASEYDQRVRVTRCSRPDLLLHELYQRLVLSLPPGGLTYEFSHVVPPQRSKKFDNDEILVKTVLDCAGTVESPLEAARVLLSESSKLDDARRLTRDAGVMDLKQLILNIVDEKLNFYDQNGSYVSIRRMVSVAELWRPSYRLVNDKEDNIPAKPTESFDKEFVYQGFKSRPVVIDSLGGVVRSVSQAVDELTARGSKKVFWIETLDYMDADALLSELLRSLAVRFGSFQSRQVTQHPLRKSLRDFAIHEFYEQSRIISEHIEIALTDYRVDASDIVILLYGRDSYGNCAGLVSSPWGGPSSNINEALVNEVFRPLHCVIEAFGRAGVKVVYFPLVRTRARVKNRFPSGVNSPAYWNLGTLTEKVEPAKDRKKRDEWNAHKAEVELWQNWPSDPFSSSEFERSAEPCRVDHLQKNSISIFRIIIEEVLKTYFDFSNPEVKSRLNVLDRQGERKLIFLYAITLFRHSRHANALCSEAVFQCPHRFNSFALDNDFLRSDEIARWIDELRESRVFFNKAGGSAWMHRDVRLTLQHFLEQLNFGDLLFETGHPINKNLCELRARLHFWIGDWYQKAFCSSGYLLPIVESIHHRVMAALYSPFAAFKSPGDSDSPSPTNQKIERYQSLIFESSMLEAHKTLLLAWKSLKLWQASPIEVSWVGKDHRDKLKKYLDNTIEKLTRGNRNNTVRDRLNSTVIEFIGGLEALSQELMLEGGGESRSTSPKRSPVNGGLFIENPLDSAPKLNQMEIKHGWETVNKSEFQFTQYVKNILKTLDAPGISKLIEDISGDSKSGKSADFLGKKVGDLSGKKAEWKHNHAAEPRMLHNTIWALGEYAYLTLRRAKLLYHSTKQIQFDYWIKVTMACNLGVDFCKHLPPWLLEFDIQSKVKLHALYGVSLANLGRSFEACRHFNEAHALLSKMPDSSPADIAIINLRRAEALITESFWIGLFLKEINCSYPTPEPLGTRTGLRTVSHLGFEEVVGRGKMFLIDDDPKGGRVWSLSAVREVLEQDPPEPVLFVPPRISECIRKSNEENRKEVLKRLYCSVLDEAVALLDQAEWNLSGHSQSGLWWSRLYTLRLRIFGLLAPLKEDARESLILRKYSADQGIFQSFHHALRISQFDPFRRFRTLKYFFEADRWHRSFEGGKRTCRTRMPDSYREAKAALVVLANNQELRIRPNEQINPHNRINRALQAAIWDLYQETIQLEKSDSDC